MKKYYEVFLSDDGKLTYGETHEENPESMLSGMYCISGERDGILVVRKSLKTCFSVMRKHINENIKIEEDHLNSLRKALARLK